MVALAFIMAISMTVFAMSSINAYLIVNKNNMVCGICLCQVVLCGIIIMISVVNLLKPVEKDYVEKQATNLVVNVEANR
jgi:uncharacterized oligopeptide transporter (OPT) family protein